MWRFSFIRSLLFFFFFVILFFFTYFILFLFFCFVFYFFLLYYSFIIIIVAYIDIGTRPRPYSDGISAPFGELPYYPACLKTGFVIGVHGAYSTLEDAVKAYLAEAFRTRYTNVLNAGVTYEEVVKKKKFEEL
jgi:hypothetical protein